MPSQQFPTHRAEHAPAADHGDRREELEAEVLEVERALLIADDVRSAGGFLACARRRRRAGHAHDHVGHSGCVEELGIEGRRGLTLAVGIAGAVGGAVTCESAEAAMHVNAQSTSILPTTRRSARVREAGGRPHHTADGFLAEVPQ